MNSILMDRNWRIVIGVGAAAGFLAIVLSILGGSHFEWKTGASGTSFDIRIGGDGGLPASLLGTISILCLILGSAFLAASSKSAGGEGDVNTGAEQTGASSFLEFLKKLKRSSTDFWIGGVCGGLGRHTPVPAWVWRAAFSILILCFGTGLLAYIILWVCMPKETARDYRMPVPPPRTPGQP